MKHFKPDSLPFITLQITDLRAPPANWPDKVVEFQALMQSGTAFPPIRVSPQADGSYGICDGVHRFYAAQLCGHSHIPAVIHKQVAAPTMRVRL